MLSRCLLCVCLERKDTCSVSALQSFRTCWTSLTQRQLRITSIPRPRESSSSFWFSSGNLKARLVLFRKPKSAFLTQGMYDTLYDSLNTFYSGLYKSSANKSHFLQNCFTLSTVQLFKNMGV